MIAAIVPAHNEEEKLFSCLAALRVAARDPHLGGEQTMVVVVLDACTDNTRHIAENAGTTTIIVNAFNVGAARAVGADLAVAAGARWLAFTDADSEVAPDWISAQLSQRCDVVCGTVAVRDWGSYGDSMRKHYDASYTDADGHRHIHGANLGVSSRAYVRAGGFASLQNSEDVALVRALQDIGSTISWSASPRVFTSARRIYRAPGGFGETLARIERESQQSVMQEAGA